MYDYEHISLRKRKKEIEVTGFENSKAKKIRELITRAEHCRFL